MKIRIVLLLTLISFLSGCVSSPVKTKQDPSLNANNASKLVIYRPSSDVLGVAIELRTFINDEFIGTLNSGGSSLERFVRPGETAIAVKPYFLGIQDGKVANIELETKTGEPVYLRLTRNIGIPVVNGNATYFIGSESGLVTVSENSWTERK